MKTSSIRLSENIHTAAKNSEYSISELARDGIEQAILGEMVGVCWICGEAIHKQSRPDWLSSEVYLDYIAQGNINESDKDWPIPEYNAYQDMLKRQRDYHNDGSSKKKFYFKQVGNRLNLPESPVEFCPSCSEYLDAVREKSISPVDIPVPYQYRDAYRGADYTSNMVHDALIAYAAEAAAVCSTSYSSFQQSLLNSSRESDNISGLFWWAARRRHENIIKSKNDHWQEIALRSNAQSIRAGKAPEPVLLQAIQLAIEFSQKWRPGGCQFPPGIDEAMCDDLLDELGDKYCPACGSGSYSGGLYSSEEFCNQCLFGAEKCHNAEEGCGKLHPVVSGDWSPSTGVYLKCYECDEKISSNELTKIFWQRYEPRLDEIKRLIPNLS